MSTQFDNSDKVTVAYEEDFGQPLNEFATLNLQYSVYTASGGNPTATAALKLTLYNPVCVDATCVSDCRCFGVLVFEPYWNQPGFAGVSRIPPKDVWETYTIDGNNGVFWWSGGFGRPNGAGGAPFRTLNQWRADLNMNSDFAGASIVNVEMGVGTYNQGVDAFFDDVRIANPNTGLDLRFDFESPMIFPSE
jgi:hypothetical protein